MWIGIDGLTILDEFYKFNFLSILLHLPNAREVSANDGGNLTQC